MLDRLKVFYLVSCIILVIVCIYSSTLLATAHTENNNSGEVKLNQTQTSKLEKIIDNLEAKDPQKVESQDLKREDFNTLTSDQVGLDVDINLKAKTVSLQKEDGTELNLKVPTIKGLDSVDIIDDKVIYSGKNSPVDTIVEAVDGGVRQVINIKNAQAPNFYDFDMELEYGDKLELTPEGGAIIKSSQIDEISNEPITKAFILKPWAKDNNGKDLTTSYSIVNGNTLRQTIDLTGASFPVVADPIWCGDAISKVEWIYRYPYYSASVYPTWCGAWNSTRQWGSWQEMYRRTPYHSQWPWHDRDDNRPTSKYWSMYNQFACHTDYAKGAKIPWNLEPAKWNVGYWNFVWNGCN